MKKSIKKKNHYRIYCNVVAYPFYFSYLSRPWSRNYFIFPRSLFPTFLFFYLSLTVQLQNSNQNENEKKMTSATKTTLRNKHNHVIDQHQLK